jgi:methionyl aminopeptidase
MATRRLKWWKKKFGKKSMKISIKTKKEIEIMRAGGKIAARVLGMVGRAAQPRMTTKELDELATKEIEKAGAKPAFKGHRGYPAATCISINDTIVHGIPSEEKIKEGDLVGIDLGVLYKGFYTDTAKTVGIGKISKENQRLLDVTEISLVKAIRSIRPGIYLGDIQTLIQKEIESAGFGVIRDLSGHGIGKELQEEPSIPNFGEKGTGVILKEGMTIAIEPMVSQGDWHAKVLDDGWTVKTADGSNSAHFEHTILVTKNGAEVLTLR